VLVERIRTGNDWFGDCAIPRRRRTVLLGLLGGLGLILALVGGALATRVFESFLFETAPTDPVTLAAVGVTLATAGCVAALVPALRAARIDPASAREVTERAEGTEVPKAEERRNGGHLGGS
jgi:TRAP-type C4-dicarboxylate transport system permease small subunit